MHELTVRWDQSPQNGDDLNAFGRNGMFRCAGIHAYDLGGRIILRPLTGKGFPARGASIDLPADAAKLHEIAAGLSAIAEQLEPDPATPLPAGYPGHPAGARHVDRALVRTQPPLARGSRVRRQARAAGSRPDRIWLAALGAGEGRRDGVIPTLAPRRAKSAEGDCKSGRAEGDCP
jgi:hypothetical protein